jgi:hypothetical protein
MFISADMPAWHFIGVITNLRGVGFMLDLPVEDPGCPGPHLRQPSGSTITQCT